MAAGLFFRVAKCRGVKPAAAKALPIFRLYTCLATI